ncbi:hypothetical protein [Hymenobacter properus]|uniref:DUF2490 domain-containing protein n=1 Tax=Hymenobacter properus TaxID=2791026 RepID=A0A931BE46_9BACT|nr:hypothetical protein [Hymenobacter properus]MBF9141739.1 hypothetical protein [Hymenobacter properus]MBR7720548.1 hypothetical protein [Microvirga sp. SRT04]
MKRISTLCLLLAALWCRPAAAQTRRVVLDHQLWANLQGELALLNGDYLLLELHGENVPAYNGFGGNDRFLGFDQRAVAFSYEHFWNNHWSGGGGLQYQPSAYAKYLTPELLLRHRGKVGPLTFGQRLSAYRVFSVGNSQQYFQATPQNYLSLRADLEKVFPVGQGGLALRPRLSYEGIMHVRLQKTQTDADERTIQYTSLRGELGVRVSNHFDFTPWFAYTTSYYFSIPQYNPISGTPTADPGRLNLVTPVIGLDARFTLFAGKEVFDRRQLSTQH